MSNPEPVVYQFSAGISQTAKGFAQDVDDGGLYGVLMSEGWKETLKGDSYYEGITK